MKNDYVDSDGDLVSKDGKNFKLSFNGRNYIRNDAKKMTDYATAYQIIDGKYYKPNGNNGLTEVMGKSEIQEIQKTEDYKRI